MGDPVKRSGGWRGRLSPPGMPAVRLWWPQEWWRQLALVCLYVLLPVTALDWIFAPPLQRAEVVSGVVMDRRGAVMRVFPVEDGRWRLRAHLKDIDPDFVDALLAYEDKRFYEHGGVDFLALGRAAGSLASAGRIVSGGSTITMQTARLLEPRPRNVVSKIIEVFRAWQLESRLSKEEILELYLTLAPYGGNLEGVRAASWAYFGREPDNLSPDQIAMLIALPQSPEARRPDLRPQAAILARKRVLTRLADEGIFAADLAQESAEYPAPRRSAFPTLAWHASEEALRRAASPDNVVTTLDLNLQKAVEDIALRTAGPLREGVQTAIMVVDIASREVRAAAGSASRGSAGGWIDLTDRPRSPGSTLKPFIYGLAFDDGLVAPIRRSLTRPAASPATGRITLIAPSAAMSQWLRPCSIPSTCRPSRRSMRSAPSGLQRPCRSPELICPCLCQQMKTQGSPSRWVALA